MRLITNEDVANNLVVFMLVNYAGVVVNIQSITKDALDVKGARFKILRRLLGDR